MAKPRVGVQLIVFGEQLQTDFAGAVQAVAEAGYDGFEMGTPADDGKCEEANAAREAAGIVCTGCHAGFRNLGNPELVSQYIRHTLALGAEFLITSGNWATALTFTSQGWASSLARLFVSATNRAAWTISSG